jgi:hypothetical protein
VCLLLYFVFWPILRYYDWGNMRLPAFKLFELAVTRNATLVSFGLLILSPFYPLLTGPPRVVWLLFLFELVAYAKIKANTLIFREFYAIEQEQHRREWYEELRHGLKAQATQVGAELRSQARVVQGVVRARVRRLARWVGAGVPPLEEPQPPAERLAVIAPVPCRYQARSFPGRMPISGMQSPQAAGANAPAEDADASATL